MRVRASVTSASGASPVTTSARAARASTALSCRPTFCMSPPTTSWLPWTGSSSYLQKILSTGSSTTNRTSSSRTWSDIGGSGEVL